MARPLLSRERTITMSRHLTKAGAVEMAARFTATAKGVLGAHPHRRYVVERGPLGLWWKVTKHYRIGDQ